MLNRITSFAQCAVITVPIGEFPTGADVNRLPLANMTTHPMVGTWDRHRLVIKAPKCVVTITNMSDQPMTVLTEKSYAGDTSGTWGYIPLGVLQPMESKTVGLSTSQNNGVCLIWVERESGNTPTKGEIMFNITAPPPSYLESFIRWLRGGYHGAKQNRQQQEHNGIHRQKVRGFLGKLVIHQCSLGNLGHEHHNVEGGEVQGGIPQRFKHVSNGTLGITGENNTGCADRFAEPERAVLLRKHGFRRREHLHHTTRLADCGVGA